MRKMKWRGWGMRLMYRENLLGRCKSVRTGVAVADVDDQVSRGCPDHVVPSPRDADAGPRPQGRAGGDTGRWWGPSGARSRSGYTQQHRTCTAEWVTVSRWLPSRSSVYTAGGAAGRRCRGHTSRRYRLHPAGESRPRRGDACPPACHTRSFRPTRPSVYVCECNNNPPPIHPHPHHHHLASRIYGNIYSVYTCLPDTWVGRAGVACTYHTMHGCPWQHVPMLLLKTVYPRSMSTSRDSRSAYWMISSGIQ